MSRGLGDVYKRQAQHRGGSLCPSAPEDPVGQAIKQKLLKGFVHIWTTSRRQTGRRQPGGFARTVAISETVI